MKVTSYKELKNDLKNYLDHVVSDSEPLIVYLSENNSVVVTALDEYNAIKETEYLSTPAMLEVIRQGKKDLAEGNTIAQEDGESISDFLKRISCTE